MPDSSDQASVERRAAWVGLRTLRQRPKIVDHTDRGAPVFEVRSVRLVLHGNAAHFNRLEQCAKCGRQVPGPPVLSPGDLDRPANTVICKDCVRAATASSPSWPAQHRRPDPPADPVVDEDVAEDGRLAAVEASVEAAAGRVAALEDHVRHSAAEVAELLGAQRAELATLSGALAETRSQILQVAASNRELAQTQAELDRRLAEMAAQAAAAPTGAGLAEAVELRMGSVEAERAELRAALTDGLARVRAEIAAVGEAGAGGLAALESDVRQGAAEMAELRESQRGDAHALAEAISDARAEVSRLVEGNRALAEAQAQLDRRLAEMETAGSWRVEETEVRLTQLIEARHAGTQSVVADALAESRAGVASLEQQLRDELETVASVNAALRRADRELDGRLDLLAERVAHIAGDVAEVTSSSQAGASRLQALEQDLHDAVMRLTTLLEASRRQSAADAVRQPPPPPVAGDLIEGLERQLQEAESRIARWVTSAPSRSE
jgi:chromosome segregation ATPase